MGSSKHEQAEYIANQWEAMAEEYWKAHNVPRDLEDFLTAVEADANHLFWTWAWETAIDYGDRGDYLKDLQEDR